MDRKLQDILTEITQEEQRILDGGTLEQTLYTANRQFVVDSRRLMKEGELLSVRTHTRFVRFPAHRHNYIEMMYVCKGSITHIINDKQVILTEGDVLLLNQHCSHAVEMAGKEDIGINFVILPQFLDTAIGMLQKNNMLADFLVNTLRQESGRGQYLHFGLKEDLQVQNVMENLIYALVYQLDHQQAINKTLLGLLFMYLVQNMKALKEDTPYNYREVMMRSITYYIDQNYQTASLAKLSERMKRSVSSISRLVRTQSGSTFRSLVQRKRFQVALELLCETQLPVGDIILTVGYENNSYFHRKFREKYQMSPKEYRQSYQIRGGGV